MMPRRRPTYKVFSNKRSFNQNVWALIYFAAIIMLLCCLQGFVKNGGSFQELQRIEECWLRRHFSSHPVSYELLRDPASLWQLHGSLWELLQSFKRILEQHWLSENILFQISDRGKLLNWITYHSSCYVCSVAYLILSLQSMAMIMLEIKLENIYF